MSQSTQSLLSNKYVLAGGAAAVVAAAAGYYCYKNGCFSCCKSSCSSASKIPSSGATETKQAPSASTVPTKEDVLAAAAQWVKYDPNPKSCQFIKDLIEINDLKGLQDAFFPRIAFGTAGLRARMAPGYKNINELVILQTTQGLIRYMQSCFPDAATRGVVVGYDGRHNSKTYAELTAAVLLSQGIKVHLYDQMVCTPLVPYAVLQLKAVVGVMVTASHNPKDDNGFKVYWDNGAQIIPPCDVGIADEIAKNLDLWQEYKFDPTDKNLANGAELTAAISKSYFNAIRDNYCSHYKENSESKMPITYTAMHGVGAKWTALAFQAFGLPPYIPTKEQVDPDPDFSTVAFPNPEEGKGALALAMKTADANGSSLILANDPDADRLAVACKNPKTGDWVMLTGNEIAAVFAEWTWMKEREKNPNVPASKYVMVASTVSSKHLRAMARKEGFQFRETLTGFKWIGNECIKAKKEGLIPLFAYEVEIGFLVGDVSFDKDGVRTAAVFGELANYWAAKGETVLDRVAAFYAKYGHFKMVNSYFFCDLASKLDKVFTALSSPSYPTACGKYKIKSVRDVKLGYDSAYPRNKLQLPQMTDSYMITFTFENGATATLRNSGTEPKLKYYVECSSTKSPEDAQALLDDMTKSLIDNFMQPDVYGLVAKKSG